MDTNHYAPPKTGKADVAHTLVKAGVASIPVLGGAAAELFQMIITPPLDRRRAEWMNAVAEGLKTLEEKVEGFHVEDLVNNDAFVSTILHASQAAIRNHQQEKLEALRNAVLNVAIGTAPNEDVQLIFLNLIDSLTPWHLRILRFFQAPEQHGRAKRLTPDSWMMGAPSTVVEQYFPELKGRRDFYDLVVSDIHARGLFSIPDLHTTMSPQGMFTKRTTALGDEFLQFVTSPV